MTGLLTPVELFNRIEEAESTAKAGRSTPSKVEKSGKRRHIGSLALFVVLVLFQLIAVLRELLRNFLLQLFFDVAVKAGATHLAAFGPETTVHTTSFVKPAQKAVFASPAGLLMPGIQPSATDITTAVPWSGT